MRREICLTAVLVLTVALVPGARGQEPDGVDPVLLQAVLPAAQRFGPLEGEPPVIRGYATEAATGNEVLVGYAFLTSDVPPEEMGYNGPIEVLVGMDLEGRLTGARVVEYHESLRSSRGDFLRRRGFQEQFAGKRPGDPFRVRRDVDGITGATITVAAMARGIRNAARRVAVAYLGESRGTIGPEELERLTWPELMERGIGDRLQAIDDGVLRVDLSLVHLRDAAMGRALMGADVFDGALERAGERAAQRQLWMVGVDGGLAALFNTSAISILRGADTLRFIMRDLVLMGEPRSGKLDGQLRNVGLLLVDSMVDPARPFTWRLEFGGGMGPYTAEHPGEAAQVVAAVARRVETPVVADAPPDAEVARDTAPVPPVSPVIAAGETPVADTAARDAAVEREPAVIDFVYEDDETVLERTLARTSWVRFGLLAAILVLATVAFLSRQPSLRWLTLGATLVVLGFGGVGFLSVSHITSAIEVGPGVFLEDLPLLLFVGYTIVTTLLWGRVFCGYLCPFGALQDLLERVVPARFRHDLPPALHERALLVKYGVLALVVLPAVLGSSMVIFQYVEPFGTIFFLSSSVLLWAIGLSLLAAAAVVPRFYCRYACPLGAALALGSLVSLFRIRRVEQCTVCKVCEQDCPTGAITGPVIDFKECVRCGVCELNLTRRVGVCRHDMEEVRSRLVQLEPSPRPLVPRDR
jgi:ferredoxin